MIVIYFTSGTLKNLTSRLRSSDIIQSACATVIRPELLCLIDKYYRLSIIDYMLGISRQCRLSEIGEFFKKKEQ